MSGRQEKKAPRTALILSMGTDTAPHRAAQRARLEAHRASQARGSIPCIPELRVGEATPCPPGVAIEPYVLLKGEPGSPDPRRLESVFVTFPGTRIFPINPTALFKEIEDFRGRGHVTQRIVDIGKTLFVAGGSALLEVALEVCLVDEAKKAVLRRAWD